MKATNLWTRMGPFLLALLLGLAGWNANPVLSQPQGQGAFEAYAVPGSSGGHGIFRCPSEGPCIFPVSDKILFTDDSSGGLAISVSDAHEGNNWEWEYYFPANSPEGAGYDIWCSAIIAPPGQYGNDTDFVALVAVVGLPDRQPSY